VSDRDTEIAARFAAAEAERLRFLEGLTPDPARTHAGWERRFVIEGTRAREAVALYRELGFEAESDPLKATDLPDGCDTCQLAALLALEVVYTRRRQQTEAS
jgi:hypothetical protein